MSKRDDILRRIQNASSLQAQAVAVADLDAFDRGNLENSRQASAWDGAGAVVTATLAPATGHERSTIATDWLGTIASANEGDDYAQRISAEAAQWFGRTSPEVRADAEEFAEQARGKARRVASAYGEQAVAANEHFLSYVSFLRTQAASGLPQVQQLVDSQENPAQTQMPGDVFDNFAGPIAPENQAAFGTETSERAPLMQEILQEGGGGGTESHHDETQQFSGPAPVQAAPGVQGTTAAFFQPSVAINHTGTLDDYRPGGSMYVVQATQKRAVGDDRYQVLKEIQRRDPDGRSSTPPTASDYADHKDWAIRNHGEDAWNHYMEGGWDNNHHGSKQAASELPQVQQVVDGFENPAPTALPTEVAYPWLLDGSEDEDEKQAKEAAYQRRAAYVAGLATKARLTPAEAQEIRSFTASLQKRADEWTQGGPQAHGPGAANNPGTTPQVPGSQQAGYSAGASDWAGDQTPTFADNSSSVPPGVQGYSEGYGDTARSEPGGIPGQLPPGAGGMQQGYNTHAGSRTAAAEYGTPEYDDEMRDWYKHRSNVTYTDGSPVQHGDKIRYHQAPGGLMAHGDWEYGEAVTQPHHRYEGVTETTMRGEDGRHRNLFGHVIERAPEGKTSSRKMASRKTATKCPDCAGNGLTPQSKNPGTGFTNCSTCSGYGYGNVNGTTGGFTGSASARAKAMSNQGGPQERMKQAMRVSASFVSGEEHGDPEFAKGYKYAAKWAAGKRLATRGSAAFEAGLYAGISDNAGAQVDWVRLHREASAKYDNADFVDRLALHRDFSVKVASTSPGMVVEGGYVKIAATSTDLDTMSPNSSPNAGGQTPINGPGTAPVLQGQSDPAAPGGPAPYNGAEPFGTPAVPNGSMPHGTPTAVDTTPGGPVDQAAMQHIDPQNRTAGLSAQALNFRRRVQFNLVAQAAEQKYPVCRGCGETFDSKETAHSVHGKSGCGTETGERGYKMTPESEAY